MFFYFFNRFIYEIKRNRTKQEKNILKERKACLSHTFRRNMKTPTLRICKRTSANLFSASYKASMTVEASFALPFFLFTFLNLMSVIEIYRLQSNLDMAMYTTVKEMAVYGHAYSQWNEEDENHLESYGLTYLYGAGRTKSCLDDGFLERMPIEGGFSGISWLHSRMQEQECIDLVATYKVKPMVGFIGYQKIPLYNRYRTRMWTGYDIPLIPELREQEKIVYITPDGSVYHETKSCPYLRLSIRAVQRNAVKHLRNQDGDQYYPCQQCAYKDNNTVFITMFGNRYHTTLQCSGLKRTIYAIPLKETGNRPECQKCGKAE